VSGFTSSYAAECFWTGVTEEDVLAQEERIRAAVSEIAAVGQPVGYSGSLLMPTDEVVLFLFEGSEDLVRQAAERAGVPFDRIVPTSPHAPIALPPEANAP
jgi:hypothetical protein